MLKKLKLAAGALHTDQRGQGMAEYGLIIALIAVVVMAALGLLGSRLYSKFSEVNDQLQ
jgi:pilus assembly protein Flp/PilA